MNRCSTCDVNFPLTGTVCVPCQRGEQPHPDVPMLNPGTPCVGCGKTSTEDYALGLCWPCYEKDAA